MTRRYNDTANSAEDLVGIASELTDEEILLVGKIIYKLQEKYGRKANSRENLDALRDEALTRLAEIGILATFDPAPCFYGEPPNVEILGKVQGHEYHDHGMDHERKAWEVKKANELDEDYRGQKEKYNTQKKA